MFCFNAADIHYGAHTNTFTYQIERKYKTKISKLCSLKLKDPLFGGYWVFLGIGPQNIGTGSIAIKRLRN